METRSAPVMAASGARDRCSSSVHTLAARSFPTTVAETTPFAHAEECGYECNGGDQEDEANWYADLFA